MAAKYLAGELSELCLGKPPLKSLPDSATVAESLAALKKSGEGSVSVWSCNHNRCVCVGKVCMVDLICFLCETGNLENPSLALQARVSDVLTKKVGVVSHLDSNSRLALHGLRKSVGVVSHLDSNSSVLEAIDSIIEGAQNLVIPIESNKVIHSKKKHLSRPPLLPSLTLHNGVEFCWLTQEDVARYLLNSISVFSPTPTLALKSLDIIDTNITSLHFHDTVSSSLESVICNLTEQKPIAIIDEQNRFIGEISPHNLACCEEAVVTAGALTTLSAGDLMAFIDYGGPDDLVHLVQMKLEEKKLQAMVELMGDLTLSSMSSSTSCSSEEEFGLSRSYSSGRFSPARRSESIVCHPWSSLVAVMVQALAHRVNYVWVIKEDFSIAGIVTLTGILKVFRSSVGEDSPK